MPCNRQVLIFVFLAHFQILVMLWFKNTVLILTHLSLIISQIPLNNVLFITQSSQTLRFLLLLNLSISVSPTNRNNFSFLIPSVIKSNDIKPASAPPQTSHLSLPIKSRRALFQSSTQVYQSIFFSKSEDV